MKKPMIPPERFPQVLAAARRGDLPALGDLLESSRSYLLFVANERLPRQLSSKFGESDLVQETFFYAQKSFGQFEGSTEDELLAWLRQGLMLCLAYQLRAYKRLAKRNVGREVPQATHSHQAHQLDDVMDTGEPPDEALAAEEQATAMRLAMQFLSDEERFIIGLRFGDEWSWDRIGKKFGISGEAARKQCTRALMYMGDFAKKVRLEGPPLD